MEPTSEQELRRMLEDGNISQSEFDQLSAAMHSNHRIQPSANKSKRSQKKLKVFAIINTLSVPCFLIALIAAFISRWQSLFVINLICTILGAISVLRCWILYWTYEENLS